MRWFVCGLIFCGIALALGILTPLPVGVVPAASAAVPKQGVGDMPARATSRLELEVPNGGSIRVDADRIYLPPGASPHAPVNLPGLTRALDAGQRGRVQVNLPATANARPTTSEVWAIGTITITLPSGARLRLDNVMPRARITFERPDDTWRVIVEPLPASVTMR
jgi:hypothetical protein